MDEQRWDDQLEPIYNSSVPIPDAAWKILRERWTIETGGERGSGRSVLAAWHDDDDDDDDFYWVVNIETTKNKDIMNFIRLKNYECNFYLAPCHSFEVILIRMWGSTKKISKLKRNKRYAVGCRKSILKHNLRFLKNCVGISGYK